MLLLLPKDLITSSTTDNACPTLISQSVCTCVCVCWMLFSPVYVFPCVWVSGIRNVVGQIVVSKIISLSSKVLFSLLVTSVDGHASFPRFFPCSSSHGCTLTTINRPPLQTHSSMQHPSWREKMVPITFTLNWAEPDVARWVLYNVMMKSGWLSHVSNPTVGSLRGSPRDVLQPRNERQLPNKSREIRCCVHGLLQ